MERVGLAARGFDLIGVVPVHGVRSGFGCPVRLLDRFDLAAGLLRLGPHFFGPPVEFVLDRLAGGGRWIGWQRILSAARSKQPGEREQ